MPAQPFARSCRSIALAAAMWFGASAPSMAATILFTVDSGVDEIDDNPGNGVCHSASGACTLRAAVMEATVVVGNDTVIVVPAGTYALTIPAGAGTTTDGPLKLVPPASGSPTLSILGAGAGKTIIDVGASLRAFTVSRVARLVGLTIRNGVSQAPLTGVGGAILNLGVGGMLVLDGCALENNQATGTVVPAGRGGAIFNSGTLTLERTTITGNQSASEGGGVYNEMPGTLYVRNSTITGNATQSTGGGIHNVGQAVIVQSTISTNTALARGGGIHNTGTANVYNATVAFNQSDLGGPVGPGGGIYNSATLNIRNTLVAGNTRPSAPAGDDCGGAIAAYGNNAFFAIPVGCAVTQNGPGALAAVGSLAELGLLQDNGGPTRTHALVAPSALVDGGDPNQGCLTEGAQTLSVDQRGYARVVGARCDLGAYESGAPGGQPLYEDGFENQTPPLLAINEVDYDQPGTDTGEFIEVRNNGAASVSLAGIALVLVNGATSLEYARVDLGPGGSLPAGGFLVVHTPGVVVAPSAISLPFAGFFDQVQNGAPDGVALIQVSPAVLLDALSYEGQLTAAQIGGFAGTVDLVEGAALGAGVADSDGVAASLCRFPDGKDTNQAAADWSLRSTPTPGLANQ